MITGDSKCNGGKSVFDVKEYGIGWD
jgi:hypothetical protein